MTCPDEDTYARLLQGLLPDSELAALERHLDECPACAELLAELGKAYSGPTAARHLSAGPPPASTPPSQPMRVPPERPTALTRIEWFAAVIHGLVTIKLGWLWVAGSATLVPASAETALVFGYALLCGPAGALLALLSAWSLQQGLSWGRRAAVVHAVLALPSVLLTPLGLYVLVRHRNLAHP